jgi:enoyl-CoA hydratase/carnithine racemase
MPFPSANRFDVITGPSSGVGWKTALPSEERGASDAARFVVTHVTFGLIRRKLGGFT